MLLRSNVVVNPVPSTSVYFIRSTNNDHAEFVAEMPTADSSTALRDVKEDEYVRSVDILNQMVFFSSRIFGAIKFSLC